MTVIANLLDYKAFIRPWSLFTLYCKQKMSFPPKIKNLTAWKTLNKCALCHKDFNCPWNLCPSLSFLKEKNLGCSLHNFRFCTSPSNTSCSLEFSRTDSMYNCNSLFHSFNLLIFYLFNIMKSKKFWGRGLQRNRNF